MANLVPRRFHAQFMAVCNKRAYPLLFSITTPILPNYSIPTFAQLYMSWNHCLRKQAIPANICTYQANSEIRHDILCISSDSYLHFALGLTPSYLDFESSDIDTVTLWDKNSRHNYQYNTSIHQVSLVQH